MKVKIVTTLVSEIRILLSIAFCEEVYPSDVREDVCNCTLGNTPHSESFPTASLSICKDGSCINLNIGSGLLATFTGNNICCCFYWCKGNIRAVVSFLLWTSHSVHCPLSETESHSYQFDCSSISFSNYLVQKERFLVRFTYNWVLWGQRGPHPWLLLHKPSVSDSQAQRHDLQAKRQPSAIVSFLSFLPRHAPPVWHKNVDLLDFTTMTETCHIVNPALQNALHNWFFKVQKFNPWFR